MLDPNKSKSRHGRERFLLQFLVQQVFPVLGRLFPFVGDDARHRGRQTGISRPAAGLHAFVQYLFAFPFHSQLTQPTKWQLEREGHLKIKPAIGCGIAVRSAREAVGFTKERRPEIPDGRGQVHVVENVSRVHRERHSVAAIRCPSIRTAAAAARSASAGPPGPRPKVPPPMGPPPPPDAPSRTGPNPKVLLSRRFRENLPGPSP